MGARRDHIEVTLARCGETAWQREGRLQGSADLPLDDEGRAALLESLQRATLPEVATVYHPTDEAATETARLLAATSRAKLRAVNDLRDPHLGLLEGMLKREFEERQSKRFKLWEVDPLALITPEGEPIADARARLFLALARLLKRTRAQRIAVVLHPLALGLFRCWLEKQSASRMWSLLEEPPGYHHYIIQVDLIDGLRAAGRVVVAAS